MPSIVPVNYRTHHLKLFGKEMTIGAMAAPDDRNTDIDGALSYLTQHDKKGTILIGLRETLNQDLTRYAKTHDVKNIDYAQIATKQGIEYYTIPIADWSPAPPETYDAIYAVIKKAVDDDKQIIIHCGAGDGRSGTALASLKLRELIEKEAILNPAILDETPKLTATVHVPIFKNPITNAIERDGYIIPCSPLVKTAIEEIRLYRTTPPSDSDKKNGQHSVETNKDIEALIQYEQTVKMQLKYAKEIALTVSPITSDPNPIEQTIVITSGTIAKTKGPPKKKAASVAKFITDPESQTSLVSNVTKSIDMKNKLEDLKLSTKVNVDTTPSAELSTSNAATPH